MAHTFVPGDKSMQKRPLYRKAERRNNHRFSFYLSLIRRLFQSFSKLKTRASSVIISFLLSAVHRLLTAHLYLKQPFSNETAAFLLSLNIVIVFHASLSLLFTTSLPDSRGPLIAVFYLVFSGLVWFGRLSPEGY